MKSLVLGILMTGLSVQTYAQEVFFKAKLKREEIPTAVVEAVETDFPDYSITEYAAVPVDIVEEDVFVDTNVDPASNYDTYQLKLDQGNGRNLIATYNANGKLMTTVEHLKDVTPPVQVRNAIASIFPGWVIQKDTYKMIHYAGRATKERYRLILSKNGSKMKVYTDERGDILKVS